MSDVEAVPSRGVLTGAMIAGMLGMAWTKWGASGLSGSAAALFRVAGLVVGLVIVTWSAGLWQSASREDGSVSIAPLGERPRSMFSPPAYWLVVALEVVALPGGAALLSATGHPEYVIAWIATAVGMHFLAFGRLFSAEFYWLGTAMIAAGIAGTMVGFAGGGVVGIKATSGLLAAASLFVAGASATRSPAPPPSAPSPSAPSPSAPPPSAPPSSAPPSSAPPPSAPPSSPRSSSGVTFANILLWAGGVATTAGLAGVLLGPRWTVPVSLCGGSGTTGRQGAAPLWWSSLGGLALTALVIVLAVVLCVVSLMRHDDRAATRSGLALLVGLVAGGACLAGAIAVFGDTPLFCF